MGAEHPIRRTTTARELAHRLGASPRTIQRIIAELRHQGWTYATIATELGITPSAVGMALHHLRNTGAAPPRSNRGRKPETKPENTTH